MRRIVLLSLLVAIAGCSSPAPHTPTPAPEAEAAPPVIPPVEAAPPASNGTRVEAFVMEGETPVGACAFVLVLGTCQLGGGDGSTRILEAEGTPLMVRGTLRWTGTLPTSVEDPFHLEALVLHEEGGQWTFGPGDPYVRGPSPLDFELPLTAFPQGKRLALQVSQSVGVPLPVGYVGAMAPHAFRLDGALESGANPS